MGLFILPSMISTGYGVDIVKNGEPKAVVITSEEALPVVKYAIGEFVDHIESASGVRLDVIHEGEMIPEGFGKIYIGQTKAIADQEASLDDLKNNGFYIINNDAGLFLAGRDGAGELPFDDDGSMGTLFAVYQWIEDQLGVRWLWPGELGTIVPLKKSIADESSRKVLVDSPFIHTRWRYGNEVYDQWRDVMSRQEREKYLYDTAVWLRRHRFARPTSFNYGHGFNEYWKRFGKEHTEWFAQSVDGVRGPIDNQVHLVQMCVSNPDLQNQVVQDWLDKRKSSPERPWINGIENDKRVQDPACQCATCKSWDSVNSQVLTKSDPFLLDAKDDTPQGKGPDVLTSISDRHARFWLALQKKGQSYDPQATVVGYAYSETALPPLETKLNERIVVGVVPPLVYPHGPGEEAFFRKLWQGWADTGARLLLRPNYFLMGAGLPYIYARQFGNDFKFAASHGMIGTDFDSLTSMWAVQGPNLYMLARLNDNPEMSVDAVLGEYYAGFGKGSEFVREYFEKWERLTSNGAAFENLKDIRDYPWSGFYLEAGSVYGKEALEEAKALIARALEAVVDDESAKKRVEFLQKGLTHTVLSLEMIEAFKKYKKDPSEELLKDFETRLGGVNKYRQSLIGENVVNLAFLNFLEKRAGIGKMQVERAAGRQVVAALPLFWETRRDADNDGLKEEWFTAGKGSAGWTKVRTDRPLDQQAIGKDWLASAKANEGKVVWYKADFVTPGKGEMRKLYLSFDGGRDGMDVWVNGKQLKTNERPEKKTSVTGGGFVVPILHALPAGQRNTVVIRLEESGDKWRGIEKPVRLLADF